MVGEADLEQVGTCPCDLVELTALDVRWAQSGGNEHAQRAWGLGQDGAKGISGGQGVPFSAGGLSLQVSGGVRPVKSGRAPERWRSGREWAAGRVRCPRWAGY